ncbi:WD40-repeat-containing domain protein [Butyriboletus roseoflavus]|nr:WD40-repeat-containing domain protein [Butyriboletus roseoflavus]
MSSTNTVLDIGRSGIVYTVAFHPDGEHLLGGSDNGIQRWRLSDGQQVTKQTGMTVYAISVSRDGKWIVCGTNSGASVWDGEMREKVVDAASGAFVWAVDVSADSTRFATGTEPNASIWSIESGERLVGPFKHDADDYITGLKFSPINGEHIAIAYHGHSIRIFNSRNGDELITLDTTIPEVSPVTPLAWSSDGQQIFATSKDKKIRSFDVSTGSQFTELQILSDSYSLALAPNDKFIATFGSRSIAFLDTSTFSQTGPVIEESEWILSIAISQDSSYLAIGREDGKMVIRHLNGVLGDSYGPFRVSTREDERPSISGSHKSKQDPGNPSHLESDGDSDLLDAEVSSGTPVDEFSYGEVGDPSLTSVLTLSEARAPSPASSSEPHEDEAPPLGPSRVISQPLGYPPVASPEEARRQENLDESSKTIVIKRWLQTRFRKSNKGSVSDRLSRKSREPADRQSPSHSPPRVDDRQEGPSMMAPARNKIIKWRTVRCSSDL